MGFSFRQFSDLLKLRDAAGKPYVLIGGQAVNYWAERYSAAEPELEALQPFTSEDIDFKGNREDVERIARDLKLVPYYPPRMAMTALAGTIPFQIGDLKSNIEIVRRVPGIPDSTDSLAFEAELDGVTIRVLDPISLLACKLELVVTVSQDQRHDVAHLKILIPCVRAFLDEFLHQVEVGVLPAKGWLGAASQVLKLTTSVRARKITRQYQLDWAGILPLATIAGCKHAKIERFREQQLEQGYKRPKGSSV